MMMYDETGLEPEADYDDEYTVGESSSSDNLSAPVYNPKPPYSASHDSRHLKAESNDPQGNQNHDRNHNRSHIYHQVQSEPQIQQVFEEYDPSISSHNYAQISAPHSIHQVYPEPFSQKSNQPLVQPQLKQKASVRPINFGHLPTTGSSTSEASISSHTLSDKNSSAPITNPTKMTTLFAPGIIPTLQTPSARIPKKKKTETDQPNSSKMDLSEEVRIDTQEGWKTYCQLMKDAEKSNDVVRMTQMLKKCLQSDISMEFLLSNDIPKIVRRLSKSHENQELKQLALHCVTKWKNQIGEKTKDNDGISKKTEKRRLSDEEKKKLKKTIKEDESPEKKKKKPEIEAKSVKTLPTKKVQAATLSSGFMDALSTSEPSKKRVIPKKKPEIKISDPLSVLDIIDSEKNKPAVVAPGVRRKSPTPPPDDVPVKANRKIKFADEVGKEIVSIRYFEIEEGERINVNRLTPEEMKHHEAMMERKFKNNIHFEDDEETESGTMWRLLPLDEGSRSPHYNNIGSMSEAKVIEEKRQRSTLKPFYDPNRPIFLIDDPIDFDPKAVYPTPREIPLYRSGEEIKEQLIQKAGANNLPVVAAVAALSEPKSSTEVKELPTHLKDLLGALKKNGIMSGEPGSTVPNLLSGSGVSSFLSTIASSQPNYSASTFTQAPIQQQPQYQQVSQPYSQFQPAQYQQQFPTSQSISTPIASTSAVIPSQRPLNPAFQPDSRRQTKTCERFMSGHCRFGDRCHFSHDQNLINRSSRGGYRGRGRPYDRRDTYDRRDDRRDTSWRDYRDTRNSYSYPERNQESASSPPQSAQSPAIQSPHEILSPRAERVVTIPAERVAETLNEAQ